METAATDPAARAMANHFAVVGLPFFWTSDRINKGVKNASDCSEIKSKKGELLA